MEPAFTVSLPTGRAAFESVVRDWDEKPRHALSVELVGQPTLYGIWRANYAANEHDFDVEVVSFGWADKYNIGNPNPVTRRKLSAAEAADVRALVLALFKNADVRKRVTPFSSKTASFLGDIGFRTNWILPNN